MSKGFQLLDSVPSEGQHIEATRLVRIHIGKRLRKQVPDAVPRGDALERYALHVECHKFFVQLLDTDPRTREQVEMGQRMVWGASGAGSWAWYALVYSFCEDDVHNRGFTTSRTIGLESRMGPGLAGLLDCWCPGDEAMGKWVCRMVEEILVPLRQNRVQGGEIGAFCGACEVSAFLPLKNIFGVVVRKDPGAPPYTCR